MHGPDHHTTGAGRSQLGNCLQSSGDLSEAEKELAEAVRISELNPDNKANLAIRYSNHGGVLKNLGRFDEAMARNQAALDIDTDLHGPTSRQVGIRLNNIAGLHKSMGDLSAAIDQARQALTIEEGQPTPDQAQLGFLTNNLGSFLLEDDQIEEAEPMMARAYQIRCDAYANPEHPSVIATADWYVTALLMRAARGVNSGMRHAKAKTICDDHDLDFAYKEADAKLRLAALDAGVEVKDFIAQLMEKAEDVAPKG